MGNCDRCSGDDATSYSCNYCSGEFCSDHRLPEKHACPGLRITEFDKVQDEQSRFQNWIDHVQDKATASSSDSRPSPLSSDDIQTVGSSRDPKYESSSDVNPDGSIAGSPSNSPSSSDPSSGDGLTSSLLTAVAAPIRWLRGQWPSPYRRRRYKQRMTELVWQGVKLTLVLGVIAALGIAFGPLSATTLLPGPTGEQIDSTLHAGGDAAMGALAVNETTTESAADPASTTGGDDTEEPVATTTSRELQRAQVERWIHVYINVQRTQHDLSNLSRSASVREMARYHSQDMAKNGYFAHEAPNGETMKDRYERFAPSCLNSVGGAENIAYIYFEERVKRDDGSTVYYDSAREVARGIVRQWMHSEGHRANILRNRWRQEGIGVYIAETSEGTRVYATQNFC